MEYTVGISSTVEGGFIIQLQQDLLLFGRCNYFLLNMKSSIRSIPLIKCDFVVFKKIFVVFKRILIIFCLFKKFCC